MPETWVRSLAQEDPLEEAMAPTPVVLPGESQGQRNLVGYSPWGCKESDTAERLTQICPFDIDTHQIKQVSTLRIES